MRTTGLILLLFITVSSMSQDIRSFTLTGVVSDKTDQKPIEDYIVDVYQGNKIIHTVSSGKKGKFSVDVFGSSQYTIEIFKEGYYPKRAIFITNVPEKIKKLSDLEFDAELIRIEDYKDLEAVDIFSTSIFDFPYVIFEYDKSSEDFYYRKAYTDHIKDQYESIADLR